MPRLKAIDIFGITVQGRYVAPNVLVSVNGRADVIAATPATGSADSFDVDIETTGAVVASYIETAGTEPLQRVSTDGGRTWAAL